MTTKVLTDRMGCLKAGVVANMVVRCRRNGCRWNCASCDRWRTVCILSTLRSSPRQSRGRSDASGSARYSVPQACLGLKVDVSAGERQVIISSRLAIRSAHRSPVGAGDLAPYAASVESHQQLQPYMTVVAQTGLEVLPSLPDWKAPPHASFGSGRRPRVDAGRGGADRPHPTCGGRPRDRQDRRRCLVPREPGGTAHVGGPRSFRSGSLRRFPWRRAQASLSKPPGPPGVLVKQARSSTPTTASPRSCL